MPLDQDELDGRSNTIIKLPIQDVQGMNDRVVIPARRGECLAICRVRPMVRFKQGNEENIVYLRGGGQLEAISNLQTHTCH